jgi:hypothetical protein
MKTDHHEHKITMKPKAIFRQDMGRSLHRFLLVAAIALVPLSALAGRYVVINGQRLNEAQIEYLERLLGSYIRNGNYWFNPYTRAWGYVGNPWPMGYISRTRYSTGRHRSLSERGLLFGTPMVDPNPNYGGVYGWQ